MVENLCKQMLGVERYEWLLKEELAEWKLTVKTLRETLADERQDRAFAGKGDTDADTPRS